MKKYILSIAISFLFASVSAANAENAYTVDDIKALAAQNSFAELLEKAKTVKPTDRNDEWKGLVTQAAQKRIDALSDDEKGGDEVKSLVTSYPFIADNKLVSTRVADIISASLMQCVNSNSASYEQDFSKCLSGFKAFISQDKNLSETAIKGAKVLSKLLNRNQLAPYFEIAARENKIYCSDADLKESVIQGLMLSTTDTDSLPSAQKLSTYCINELKPALEASFDSELKGSFYRQNTCQLLKKSCE